MRISEHFSYMKGSLYLFYFRLFCRCFWMLFFSNSMISGWFFLVFCCFWGGSWEFFLRFLRAWRILCYWEFWEFFFLEGVIFREVIRRYSTQLSKFCCWGVLQFEELRESISSFSFSRASLLDSLRISSSGSSSASSSSREFEFEGDRDCEIFLFCFFFWFLCSCCHDTWRLPLKYYINM